jgi:cellulose synthase/poly-beta-1,6-N-acetylglucosamine synthase-like glycosyltransferase
MNWSLWIRQSHRWLSIVFTLTVIANFVFRAAASGDASAVADLLTAATALSSVVFRPVPVRASVYHQVAQQGTRLTSQRSGRRTGAADFRR